jgi:hypothetical protein
MKLLMGLILIASASVAQAKLVEDHSAFNGIFVLTDGNVKECRLQYHFQGQPDGMVNLESGQTEPAADFDPQSVPVGRRNNFAKFLSATEFEEVFVDNIDVPGVLVQITTDYQINAKGDMAVVITNSAPDPRHFSMPALTQCLYQKQIVY